MTKLGLITATAALLATTSVAGAHDWSASNDIDRRQERQESRIQEGRRDGSLTRSEAYRLESEQARIRDLERRAKADGHIDRREAADLRRAQDQAGRHIYQERHDGEVRGWRRWYSRWW